MISAIPIVGDLIGLGKTWIEGKQKQAQARAEAEATAMKTAAQSEASWQKFMAKGAANSWKDEYWTVILSIPAIMCFIPGGLEHARQGFDALGAMPDYYQYFLGVSICASYGVKGWKQFLAR